MVLLALAAPATADWLVTRSGDELETAGAWEVAGALVIFKTVDGRLASIRSRDVDLDASRALTERPAAVPEVPAEEPGERTVRVITDADVADVAASRGDFEPAAPSADPDPPPAPAEVREGGIEVITWSDRVDVEANRPAAPPRRGSRRGCGRRFFGVGAAVFCHSAGPDSVVIA